MTHPTKRDKATMLDIGYCFFQAEDGIRDLTVTGVQTCALPISEHRPLPDQQPVACGHDDAAVAAAEFPRGLRVRQAALPRARAAPEGTAGRAGDPQPGGDVAAVSDDEMARPRQHLCGGGGAGDCGELLGLPWPA